MLELMMTVLGAQLAQREADLRLRLLDTRQSRTPNSSTRHAPA